MTMKWKNTDLNKSLHKTQALRQSLSQVHDIGGGKGSCNQRDAYRYICMQAGALRRWHVNKKSF